MLSKSSGSKPEGKLFIVSAPSGAGKTTLCQEVLKRLDHVVRSVSYTTRPRRSGETQGVDYYFIDPATFEDMKKQNAFAEWAVVHGHLYGTSKAFLQEHLSKGEDVIFNIDVQGAHSLKQIYPEAVRVFIEPPSKAELKKRLLERKSDSKETILKRLAMADEEKKAAENFEYFVVNDTLERATAELVKIIQKHRKS
ncbi:MAG: guanylate kinase [Deltaproteobacteria bacterium]|nr:guanylate kinase [Deltaproteobacteria bacterium]